MVATKHLGFSGLIKVMNQYLKIAGASAFGKETFFVHVF